MMPLCSYQGSMASADGSSALHSVALLLKLANLATVKSSMTLLFNWTMSWLSEEKIEYLFGCTNQNRNERRKNSPSLEPTIQYIQIIDTKKAQNLSILLQEVVDALKEGNGIPAELSQTLLKMAPTMDEELKLRLYTGEITQLGLAERFLKVSCYTLRKSRLFLKLLEAVLKTGNRMNDGTYRG